MTPAPGKAAPAGVPLAARGRARMLVLGAAALLVVMMGAWGVSGALRVQALRREIDAARRDLDALEARRQTLTETIDRLRNDPGYLEKLAREEHGLVREGETVLKFPSRR